MFFIFTRQEIALQMPTATVSSPFLQDSQWRDQDHLISQYLSLTQKQIEDARRTPLSSLWNRAFPHHSLGFLLETTLLHGEQPSQCARDGRVVAIKILVPRSTESSVLGKPGWVVTLVLDHNVMPGLWDWLSKQTFEAGCMWECLPSCRGIHFGWQMGKPRHREGQCRVRFHSAQLWLGNSPVQKHSELLYDFLFSSS